MNSREYKDWRENGVAFKLRRDAPYQTPNKSLASAMLLREVRTCGCACVYVHVRTYVRTCMFRVKVATLWPGEDTGVTLSVAHT